MKRCSPRGIATIARLGYLEVMNRIPSIPNPEPAFRWHRVFDHEIGAEAEGETYRGGAEGDRNWILENAQPAPRSGGQKSAPAGAGGATLPSEAVETPPLLMKANNHAQSSDSHASTTISIVLWTRMSARTPNATRSDFLANFRSSKRNAAQKK